MEVKRYISLTLLYVILQFCASAQLTTVFSDDFNRGSVVQPLSNGGTPAMTWTTATTSTGSASSTGATSRTNNTSGSDYSLQILPGNSGALPTPQTSGQTFVTGALSTFASPFSNTLSSNIAPVVWTFNVRTNRSTALSGFSAGNYGSAIVLASSGSALNSGTNGYAVIHLKGSTFNTIKLIRYTNGLQGTQTVLAAGSSDLQSTNTSWANVKVVYTPISNNWQLFADTSSSSSGPKTDFSTVTTQLGSTITDATYTGSSLTNFGFYYNHGAASTPTSNTAFFDNFKVVVNKPEIKINYPSFNTPANGYLLSGFVYTLGFGPSTPQMAVISGTDLQGAVTVIAPPSYQIQDTALAGSGNYYDTLTYFPVSGTLNPIGFNVRLISGLSLGNYNERINIKSQNATLKQVICNGNVTSDPFVFVSATSLSAFPNTDAGSYSISKNFTVAAANIGANPIQITAPVNFQISLNNSTFSGSLTLTPNTSGTVSATVIYVRYAPTGTGSNSASITISNALYATQTVALSGYFASFFYKGSGFLNVLSNWSAKSDGSGLAPNDFSTPGVFYKIITDNVNTGSSFIPTGNVWSISGTGSRLVIGDPSFPGVGFTYVSGVVNPISATINIPAASTGSNKLFLQDPNTPDYGIMHSSSEVHYQATTNSSTTASFGKLYIENNSTMTLNSTPTIQSLFFIAEGSTLNTFRLSTYCKANMLSGSSLAINGTIEVQNAEGLTCTGCTPTSTGAVFNFIDPSFSCIIGSNSTIRYSKTAIQKIQPHNYSNLEISGGFTKTIYSSGGAGSMVYVSNKLEVSSGTTLVTNDLLTLRSDSLKTARLAPCSGIISGNVIVERFISARKAWRLLAMPTQHNLQTINQSWQEGATIPNANPNPGYGTQIASNRTSWLSDGFDTLSINGPSIKTYNSSTGVWDGIISTKAVSTPNPSDGKFILGKAYMTFIRGSRAKTRFTDIADYTILREKGSLNIGPITINPQISSGQFAAVANPYASALNYNLTSRSALAGFFYLWDPKLGTYGGYQTISADGLSITPRGGSYENRYPYIESGQGFFIQADNTSNPHTITFTENTKVDASALVSRTTTTEDFPAVKIQLYQASDLHLMDGAMIYYDPGFSNGEDAADAKKIMGFGEQIFIQNGFASLSVDGRQSANTEDTIHLRISSMKPQGYKLGIELNNMNSSGRTFKLLDHFTGQSIDMIASDTNWYAFSINSNPASYNQARFDLVSLPISPVLTTFTNISAKSLSNRSSLIIWSVSDQTNIASYDVQRSADGSHFVCIGTLPVKTSGFSNTYSLTDNAPEYGKNYYRVDAIHMDSSSVLSDVVLLHFQDLISEKAFVYPNPVIKNTGINLFVSGNKNAKERFTVFDITSKKIFDGSAYFTNGKSYIPISTKVHMPPGVYFILLSHEGKEIKIRFSVVD